MPTPSQPKELTPEQQELLEVARACGERQVKEGSLEAMRNFTAALQVFRDSILGAEAIPDLLGKSFLGAEVWKMLGVDVIAPPLPKKWDLDYFSAPCPFFPDKLKKDTHLLVLIPERVSLSQLHKLSKEIKSRQTDPKEIERYSCFRGTDWAKDKKFWIDAPKESRWAFILKEGLPGSFGKVYAKKLKDLEKYQEEYQVGEAIELYTAAALTRIKNGELILPDNFLMCRDEIGSGVLASGGSSTSSGFRVDFFHVGRDRSNLGLLASAKS